MLKYVVVAAALSLPIECVAQSRDQGNKLGIDEIISVLGVASRGRKKDAPRKVECTSAILNLRKARGSGAPNNDNRMLIRDCTAENARLDFTIPFEFNSAAISQQALPQLRELGRALQHAKLRSSTFIVAGHTDAKGSAEYNLKLSQRRAAAVRRYLVERYAISGERLAPIGYGFDSLKDPGNPNDGVNRRVEFVRTD